MSTILNICFSFFFFIFFISASYIFQFVRSWSVSIFFLVGLVIFIWGVELPTSYKNYEINIKINVFKSPLRHLIGHQYDQDVYLHSCLMVKYSVKISALVVPPPQEQGGGVAKFHGPQIQYTLK